MNTLQRLGIIAALRWKHWHEGIHSLPTEGLTNLTPSPKLAGSGHHLSTFRR